MPKLKNKTQSRGLAKISTWITDTNPFSDYFRLTQVPDVIPGGKSGFLINGSPLLVRSTELLVELVDADGNAMYTHPIKNYQEGLARVVGQIEQQQEYNPGFSQDIVDSIISSDTRCILGIAKMQERPRILLDMDRLFSTDELARMSA